MTQQWRHRTPRRRVILSMIFVAALAAAAWFGAAVSRSQPLPQVNYLAADKSYGVTIDLTRTEAARDATLNSLRENGLRWLRLPVRWQEIEPTPGQFHWTPLDDAFAAIERHNHAVGPDAPPLKVIVALQTSPVWARPATAVESAPPQNVADFGHFARVVAARYGDRLDHYQIWHEPNLSAGWGNAFVDAAAYARLLREAALNIRAVDPTALILTAALAPTRETGPLNLNEMTFLEQLYRANAAPWFDIVAGQPYGFDFEPASPPDPDRLNFRRLELLRQVMLAHGDAATPIWATAAGYNALPADWAGHPSPWRDDQNRTDPPQVQTERTAGAITFARQHWPWLGPLLAVRWDSAGLPADDPARGFALAETPLLQSFRAAATAPPLATVGRYPADHPSGNTGPGWRTALTLADAPRAEPRTLAIDFTGGRLDLVINRGDYRGYLWVTVDGQPANALPQDSAGRSYVVLHDPQQRTDTVTLAQNLPPGRHRAVIQTDGGWEQWAIAGWIVSNSSASPPAKSGLALAGLILAVSGAGLLWQRWLAIARGIEWLHSLERFLPGDGAQIAVVFGLALAFYFAPASLSLLLLAPLALALIYRPDLALALLAFSLSFFQAPRPPVSLTETPLLLAAVGVSLRFGLRRSVTRRWPRLKLRSLDGAALALLGLGYLSTLAAPNFGVNMFAWRTLILGPVVFYFLVCWQLDFGPGASKSPERWAWRLVDALAAGATLHAGLALWGYFAAGQSITAQGVARALSPVYVSPNNLALFLGRVLPILLAVALLPGKLGSVRRWLYGVGAMGVGAALYLTYSRGALLIGLPASIITMAVMYGLRFPRQRRRALLAAGGGLAIVTAALLPLSQTGRLQSALSFDAGGTAFFRLKLWQSSLNMLRDYWPLGIGPGNFLYLYRTRYILPEAWPEPNLSHPHNVLLDFATRLGLGGLLLLGWLQIGFWRQAWRLYRRWPTALPLGLMGSMAAFLSHGLIDNSYFLVDLAFLFFLTAGLVRGCEERIR